MTALVDHLEKLPVFVRVARSGSFHKAALAMRLAQPTLSQSVRTLERALGKQLFLRHARGVTLTWAGAVVLEFAEAALRDAEIAERSATAPAGAMVGAITFGTFESLAAYFWPGFLAALVARYPHLSVALAGEEEAALFEGLRARRHDVVVSAEPAPKKHFVQTELYRDAYGFYMAPGSKLSGATILSVPHARDIEGMSIEEHLHERGLLARARIRVTTFGAVRALARQGLGVGILPVRVAREDVRSRKLRAVRLPEFDGPTFGDHRIVATLLRADAESPRLRACVDELVRYAARLSA